MRRVYRTVWVQNWSGSNIGGNRAKWSFTVDVTVFTFGKIDDERLENLADYTEKTSQRIIDNSGLYNPTFDTYGSEVDIEFESSDTVGLGIYYARLDVEDEALAVCDFRYRPDISTLVDDSVSQMDKAGLLDYSSLTHKTRLSRILKSISRAIQEFARLARAKSAIRRRSREGKA